MADFEKKQFVDLPGLTKYDEKIKDYISDKKSQTLDEISRGYVPMRAFEVEVEARQNIDATHTADIATNKKAIEDLTAYVGTIPEVEGKETPASVIAYIQEKTSGIATDAALTELTERVKDVEDNKVDKVTGKDLSDENYTAEEKNKLAGIAAGAQVNVIEAVKVNGVALNITDKAVDVTVPTGALASKDKVAEADLETALADKLNGKANQATTYTKDEVDALVKDAKDYADNNDANETFAIAYDKINKKITLTGSDGTNSEIPADDFIKDGMIDSVAISEDGTKLVITWNTDAGKDATEIALTELVDVMTGVDGTTITVNVSADDKISAEVKTGSLTDGHIAVNAAIAKEKLAAGVQTSLGLADTAVQPAALNNYYTKTEADTEFMNAAEVNSKIAELDADVTSAEVEKDKGIRVQVVEVDGKVTTVAVTGNYDAKYDALGEAAAVYAAIEAVPTASIEALFKDGKE